MEKELLIELKKKEILLFQKNGFRFKGIINNVSDKFIEMLDYKSKNHKIISIDSIASIDMLSGEDF